MSSGMTVWGWIFMICGWGICFSLSVFCIRRIFRARRTVPGGTDSPSSRDLWASRTGLILATAGNAIGLGNFLRFPVKAASNGGGTFMIPYFCAFLLLGIPLMWTEWTIGRMGGLRGHGTSPGMFTLLWRHPLAKYLGALGIVVPFTVVVYYNFIESWTLAFAWFSGTGQYFGHTSREMMGQFLRGFQGVESNQFFSSPLPALLFLGITLAVNFYFLYRGISRGIEILAKIGMPLLLILAIALAVRVLTLGTPHPLSHPDWSVWNGLAFIWNPDFSRLSDASVWLAAAGQIFFTLGVAMGIMTTYASYIREREDLTLNGLTTASTNEFVEVVLGGTIAIPVAVAFFGLAETQEIARQGAYDLGFQALPVIFQQMPLGQLFGAMWFVLLFIAGITSSVALTQPAVALLEDEFGWSRKRSVLAVFAALVPATLLVFAWFRYGFLDELDFWSGTLGLVLLGLVEAVLFAWVYGVRKGWTHMHQGADLRVPRLFQWIMTYITPVYILIMLVAWIWQGAIGQFFMKGKPPEWRPYLWGARGLLFVFTVVAVILIRLARRRIESEEPPDTSPAAVSPSPPPLPE
jgi:NSS family neurotransmitter:Na+ symporter